MSLRLLADNDVEGVLDILLQIWTGNYWRELWEPLAVTVESFESLQLSRDAPDAAVWTACQNGGVVLITGNRNADRPDSLEPTIRLHNQLDSLPVLTIADATRVVFDNLYAERAAERALDYLMNIENHCGAGRLFVP